MHLPWFVTIIYYTTLLRSGLTLLSEHRNISGDSIFEFAERKRGSGDNRREKGELERWFFQPIALVVGAVLRSGGEGEGHC